jgi:plastocyanin
MARRLAALLAVVGLLAAGCGGGAEPDAEAEAENEVTEEAADEDELSGGLAPAGGYQEGIRDNCLQLTRGETSEIIALDNMFAPECAVVVTNQVLRIRNLGVRDHTFTISEQVFKQTPFLIDVNVEGGESTETEFVLDDVLDSGVYTFYCSFHAGMDGELQVLEAITS